MNRLQKKCAIATAGIHLLLLLILVFGSAFFQPRPKPDDTQLLTVISATTVDAALNSGVKDATPPAPVVLPQPPPPAPVIQTPPQPPTPTPKPVAPPPTLAERVEKIFTPEPKPEPVKPAPPKPAENQTHKITINTQLVVRVAPKNPTPNPKPDNSKAINSAIKNLTTKLKPGPVVDMPGESSAAAANYASVVKSVYDAAWTLPDTIAKDENITVKVTIASDGTVISSRITERSGDVLADSSVQRTLDRVSFVAPFPEGTTDKQRIYTIVFNPQVKNSE